MSVKAANGGDGTLHGGEQERLVTGRGLPWASLRIIGAAAPSEGVSGLLIPLGGALGHVASITLRLAGPAG